MPIDLSSHRHTDECNTIIKAYMRCHEEHPFARFVGYCNPLSEEMKKCLKGERIDKRANNMKNAKDNDWRLRPEFQEKNWRKL